MKQTTIRITQVIIVLYEPFCTDLEMLCVTAIDQTDIENMVKNMVIIYLIIQFLVFACTNNESKINNKVSEFDNRFSIYQDTINVQIKGKMTHALKYHEKFFILFEQQVLEYGGYGKRWLYIFSNGKLEKIIDCPQKMETVYLDFYVKNDSIILKPYMDKQFYQLDLKNYSWKQINKTDDLIFEDEKFEIYSLDFGEWGGKTWFKDKNDGTEYLIESTTPLINRIGTSYYLTNAHEVLKIKNPYELNKCSNDVTYENIETSKKCYSWYGKSIGFDFVYKDTTIKYFDDFKKPYFVSSFVLQNELFHVYETDTVIYIAKIENNLIKPFKRIAENLKFYNWFYSYRCRNFQGNNELLKFTTKKQNVFGLLEIIDNKILLHYFINKTELSPKIKGSIKSDSIIIKRLNTILKDFNSLKLNSIANKEEDWNSFDITPNHKIGIGDCWNPKKYIIDTSICMTKIS